MYADDERYTDLLIETGACVDWIRIDGAIGELYDVAIIPGSVCAMAVSPGTNEAATLITR